MGPKDKMTTSEQSDVDFCSTRCADAEYCCNSNPMLSSNQYKSCAQACLMVLRGTPYIAMHTSRQGLCGVRGCNTQLNGTWYLHCGTCTDLTTNPKCNEGVPDEGACNHGAYLGNQRFVDHDRWS